MKKIILLTIFTLLSLLILRFILIGFIAYTQRPHLSAAQWYGNYFDRSMNEKEKLKIGFDSCETDTIKIVIGNEIMIKYNNLVDSLIKYKTFNYERLKYLTNMFLNGNSNGDPNLNIIMPKMKYDNCHLDLNGNKFETKIKLTGGQIDHYDTERRSLRIKSVKNILNMDAFNLYHPKSRMGGLYEWVGNLLLKREGLITLNTGYVSVTINKINKGIYFYQEHPTSNMLENNNKNPGLLFRLCLRDNKDKPFFYHKEDSMKLAVLKYYDKKKLKTKINFNKQKLILEEKLNKFNNKEIPLDSLVSIEKLSKFSAVLNLINGHHSLWLGNCIFYLNPRTLLIEPIGREFGTSFYVPSYSLSINPPYYLKEKRFQKEKLLEVLYPYSLDSIQTSFYEKKFKRDLKRVSDKSYLDSIFNSNFKELKHRQFCLFKGDPSFKIFNKNIYYENQTLLKKCLEEDN